MLSQNKAAGATYKFRLAHPRARVRSSASHPCRHTYFFQKAARAEDLQPYAVREPGDHMKEKALNGSTGQHWKWLRVAGRGSRVEKVAG